MNTIIEVRDVTYSYPLTTVPQLKDINLKIQKGKFYGVIGENGSGKTTLCSLLRGFIPSFYKGELNGEVLFKGEPLESYKNDLSRHIGFIFQNPFTQISGVKDTVFEEVAYGLENMGVEQELIIKKVVDVMKLTNIEHLADKNPMQLSGGQMQRVAIASVIVLEPELIIIDEPTSQLDPEGTESVFKVIKKLKEQGITIILVEHKVDLLAEYSDEIIVMQNGSIFASGNKTEVLSSKKMIDSGIEIPQVTRLASELIKNGVKLQCIPVTEEEAIMVIKDALKEKNK